MARSRHIANSREQIGDELQTRDEQGTELGGMLDGSMEDSGTWERSSRASTSGTSNTGEQHRAAAIGNVRQGAGAATRCGRTVA
jgi:hypothetical protein